MDLLHHIEPFLQTHGYWVIATILCLENMGLPLPGELILISSGVLCFQGKLELTAVAGVAVTASILGDNLGYLLGRHYGSRLLDSYSRFFDRKGESIEQARQIFLRHSHLAVLLGRFVAFLRILAGPLAGVLGMPWRRFLLFNSLGALLWVSVILGASYCFGHSVDKLFRQLGLWGVVGVGILGVLLKIHLGRLKRIR